ncbi:MAG: cell envelope integrity protein TolA [Chlorobiaceae bacterium]|nr:cell envelope integrity protein TolA [Chlorobiaceae bacterium]NTV16676.1 cell envelope integrity protein TolA [Chlorobiaceae bacterium]
MKKGQKLVYTEKKFSFWLAAAAAMHVVVLFLVLYFQIWDSGRHIKPKIVSVSLVSLPGSGGAAMQAGSPGIASPAPVVNKADEEPKPETLPPVVQKKAPVETPKQVAVEPPKKIPAEPVKPKIVEKPQNINTALERLKQNVDKKTAAMPQPSTGVLNKALASLQQKVQSAGKQAGTGNGGSGGLSSSGGRGGGGYGYGGGGNADPYKAQIASIIQQNWAFSKQLLKNSYGMNVYVRINIISDGTIRQIVFDKRAPSEYLNNSVKKALEKSSPLPFPPKGEALRDIWIGFVFTPEGIE